MQTPYEGLKDVMPDGDLARAVDEAREKWAKILTNGNYSLPALAKYLREWAEQLDELARRMAAVGKN